MNAEDVLNEISAAALLADLREPNGELALLDVREERRLANGHILLATSLPLSRLEVSVADLVPRPGCRIVLYDDNDGLARIAAARLRRIGYGNASVLRGGLPGWIEAGGEIFQGLNTPSKALGVYAQQELAIPEIEPGELSRLLNADGGLRVVDCRPYAEYQRGTIPGAVNCPGAELLSYEMNSGAGLTVVTCAGRTRGLLGARTLTDFGFSGNVVALKEGTMGWELTGRALEKAAGRALTEPARGRPNLQEAAERIRHKAGIEVLTGEKLGRWRSDPDRTTYLFDIRQAAEFEAGHISGARHATGGQLVQNFDQYVATLKSRIVLCDDDGVRATAVALWLRRMGLREVGVIRNDDASGSGSGNETRWAIRPPGAAGLSAEQLRTGLENGDVLLIDLATSRDYRAGHIPGAWFAVRSRLMKTIATLPRAKTMVLTSEDGAQAAFASTDGIPFEGPIRVLEGGTAAWRRAGYPLSKSQDRLADEMDDVVLKPSELSEGREAAIRDYLSGSEGLLEKIQRDGTLHLTAMPAGA